VIDLVVVLQFATPLILASLGELVLEKSGVLNLGLEGAMLLAAFAGAIVSLETSSPWAGLAGGTLAGLLLTFAVAAMAVKWGSDQVVAGTAATLLAMGLTSVLYRSRFGETGMLMTLPKLPAAQGFDAIMLACAAVLVGVGLFMLRTKPGLALRACGEYPAAAEAAGFSVDRLRLGASLFAGALAGLGGAYLAIGVVGSFGENMTAGKGFLAIAMVTFGRWKPIWTVAGCLLVGYLDALQYFLQAKGWNLPYQLFVAMPYVAALLVLAMGGRSASAPAALGRPHRGDS
jgi:simple sugar transport system permease protein